MFSRVTTSGEYLAEIDGLRFTAIVSVLLFHCAGLIEDDHPICTLLRGGSIGVQLFFAISGFILARPFLKHYVEGRSPVVVRRYYLRRLTRLEPPYLINLTLFAAAATLGGYPDVAQHFLASATYTHYLVFGNWSTINHLAWSLEVEAQFYLAMPLIAYLCFRIRSPMWRRLALLAPCVPAIVWQMARHGAHFPHGFTLLDQLQFFAVGIVLADVFLDFRSDEPAGSIAWDGLATLGFVVTAAVTVGLPEMGRIVSPLSIAAFFAGSLKGRFWRAFARNRWISVVGGMCYTIYLFHLSILEVFMRPQEGAGFVENFLTAGVPSMLAALAISAVLFLAFEKPFMRLGVRRSS